MGSTAAAARAFEELYRETFRQIYGFIFLRVQHQQTAEDLTSETFYKAQRSWPPRASDPPGRKAWLIEIARNVVRDYARAERRRPAVSLDESDEQETAGDASAPDLDAALDLRMAMAALAPRDQELLSLRLAGFSNGEIGEVLDMRAEAVCMAIKRALGRLAQTLEQEP